ncbi:MAG: hypothetical protein MW690_001460 [Methanophagales archaeon]|nr:hypothetical protein [Methanophagales archaeon]MCU4139528.1 hypothetical protein [Methanophagales archaeon]
MTDYESSSVPPNVLFQSSSGGIAFIAVQNVYDYDIGNTCGASARIITVNTSFTHFHTYGYLSIKKPFGFC